MKNQISNIKLFALMILLIMSSASCAEQAPDRPNIIFIFADDWGWGDLGIHGSDIAKTPYIDQLAADGANFHQFTVNSPVCSPSRVAVMTGHFPERYSVGQHFATIEHHKRANMPDWLNPEVPLVSRMLQEAGYVTGHFGKWHLTNDWIDDAPMPDQYGYDEYGAFNIPGKDMPAQETADRAVDFIRKNHDKPFFINLWIHETHTPHYPEPKLLQEFAHIEDEAEQVYAAILAAGDRDVGKILATLDELHLAENTLVIFSSDNGPESPTDTKYMDDLSTGPGFGRFYSVGSAAGMKGQKRSLYSGGVRVPFIVRWPKVVKAGIVDKTTVLTAVDLLPTFVAAANAELPKNYQSDGENFLQALKGESFQRQKPVYWVWPPGKKTGDASVNWPHTAYQKGDWKLLFNATLDKTELYHVTEDWYESRDLAKENPDTVKELMAEMEALRQEFPESPDPDALSSLRKK